MLWVSSDSLLVVLVVLIDDDVDNIEDRIYVCSPNF